MKNKKDKLFYLYAFLLSFIIASIFIIPKIIMGGGIYLLVGDFNVQQIPFMKLINESIKTGNILWSWHNDLGSNFIGSFSFYNLFTPFTLITLLFKSSFIPYLIGPLCILKLGFCGLTSYLYLKEFVKNKKYALLGSILYTFSGFQITNYMFPFYDVIILFPLLLLALEKAIIDNKKGFLGIMVAISLLTNYFFFIGEMVFILIYIIVKVTTKDFHLNKEKIKTIIIETVLGISISAFIILPTFYFIIGNPRTEIVLKLKDLFIYPFREYLQIYKSLIMAPDIMPLYSLYTSQSWTSTECYLPFIGLTLVISYIINKPKNWISILIIISIIMMMFPILNSLFLLLNQTYYSRWFYMPILLFSLASIKLLEENISFKYGLIYTLLLFIMLPFLMLDFTNSNEYMKLITNKICFYTIMGFTLSSFIILTTLYLIKVKNIFNKIFILTIIYSILISSFNIYYASYYYRNSTNQKYYKEYIYADKYIKVSDINARIDFLGDDDTNLTMNVSNPSTKAFISTINGSIFEFYKLIGINRTVQSEIDNDDYILRTFLSNKYLVGKVINEKRIENGITYIKESKIKDLDSYKVIHNDEHYTIYENINYLPIGYTFDKYISINDYKKISNEYLIPTLLKGLVLNDEQIKEYGKYLTKLSIEELNTYKKDDFSNLVKDRQKESSNKVIFKKNGLISNINLNKENLVFYSIPHDKGWRAYVNDKKTDILTVDGGFMAVLVKEGNNTIEFKYYPEGLNTGIIISISSMIIFGIYLRLNKYKKK